jgi:predicted type IV restriction endonuclease
MSANARQEPRADAISLSDEDAVKQVLVDSILGLWDLVNPQEMRPSRCSGSITTDGSAIGPAEGRRKAAEACS